MVSLTKNNKKCLLCSITTSSEIHGPFVAKGWEVGVAICFFSVIDRNVFEMTEKN